MGKADLDERWVVLLFMDRPTLHGFYPVIVNSVLIDLTAETSEKMEREISALVRLSFVLMVLVGTGTSTGAPGQATSSPCSRRDVPSPSPRVGGPGYPPDRDRSPNRYGKGAHATCCRDVNADARALDVFQIRKVVGVVP